MSINIIRSRYFSSATTSRALPAIKLYQYDICPFCCKVKAFLNWQKIPYSAIDVNPLTKSEISFSKNYKKVPIMQFGDEVVVDSSRILERLAKEMSLVNMPSTISGYLDLSSPEVKKWMEFVDKKLAVLLFPNITRSMFESWKAFGYINKVPHFGVFQKLILRVSGSLAMRMANGKIKKKYNIEDERVALQSVITEWISDGLKGRKFHGGDKAPDTIDVLVYGCLKSIEEFSTFAWLIENNKDLLVWYNRMAASIGGSSCIARE